MKEKENWLKRRVVGNVAILDSGAAAKNCGAANVQIPSI